MCAVTCPLLVANRIRSPACTMGTLGSGGAKHPHASAGAAHIATATAAVSRTLEMVLIMCLPD